ncbi:glycerophosphodiester phosphodiesterase [Neobacillus ginsengisoli]|uniref:Glycerophosphoryl diester phosphodiesterase n=1 Tax=Neobacillus ginsengisoli TaxID=904295 RepID=A0ABT9XS18_9BACI|nr:glycerophosphodiester phosphodiesterase family protein [Neobacillus ginsengisoli]MDQ0198350.1 glycerophosphoryl diester phosphodiesterase [Neobacillus ginsengisoli]
MRYAVRLLFLIFKNSHRILKRDGRKFKNRQTPLKIGHRGAAGYCPENTFASFNKALEMGVDYLEIDVQMTRDGELVVIHDSTVNRTTDGKGKVKDFTLQEIQALDAGSWFNPTFSGERIPSFKEFLENFAGKTGIVIELKKPSLYPGIEEKVAKELKKRTQRLTEEHKIIVQSFDRKSLKRFHNLMPSIPIGVLIKNTGRGISNKELNSFSHYASYVNPKITMVNPRLIRRLHRNGFKTIIWTVKNKQEMKALQQLHLDGIVSDFPDYF